MVFLSGAYLGNCMTYLDDIWYVGGSRAEVAHAEFWVWQMPIKYLIFINLCKNLSGAFLGNRMPHVDDMWYVGRARAEGAHGDLDGGQRSSEVKWGKLCAMATIFGQEKPWCKLRMMMTLMEVKGHQRSNGVNYVLWLPYLVKRSPDASWEWWWPWWRSKVIRGQMG